MNKVADWAQVLADGLLRNLPEELAAGTEFAMHESGDSLVVKYPVGWEGQPLMITFDRLVREHGAAYVSRGKGKSFYMIPKPKPTAIEKTEAAINTVKAIAAGGGNAFGESVGVPQPVPVVVSGGAKPTVSASEQLPKPVAAATSPAPQETGKCLRCGKKDVALVDGVMMCQECSDAVTKEMNLPPEPTPEASKPVPEAPKVEKAEPVVLTSKVGVVLGSMQREGSRVFVRPDNHISFNIQTAPFNNFLLEKVIIPMHQVHAEFNYDVIQTDNVLGEVMLTGVSDLMFKSLLGSFRWTFEKMYEKQVEPKATSQPKPQESTASAVPAKTQDSQPREAVKKLSSLEDHRKTQCVGCPDLSKCDISTEEGRFLFAACLQVSEKRQRDDLVDRLFKLENQVGNIPRMLDSLVGAVLKIADRPVYRGGGGGQRKDPPKERHSDGGISWFWNEAKTYEKALDAENKDSKEYAVLKTELESLASAGKKGKVIGDFWYFLDSFKKDGPAILRKKAQDFSQGAPSK